MNNIIKKLMEDGITTKEEAIELIHEAQDEIYSGVDPNIVMHNTLCLEPEYVKEVMNFL